MFDAQKLILSIGKKFEKAGVGEWTSFIRVAPADKASERSLIFINKPDEGTIGLLRSTSASVVLLEATWGYNHLEELKDLPLSIFLVESPRYMIARILALMNVEQNDFTPGIHTTAIIHSAAVLHPSVTISAFSIIEKCEIGENSIIGSHSIIKDGVIIGKNVIIREHCLIGGPGFGMVRDEHGQVFRMPHIGHTVIEDDVEIFPYTNVDRATFGVTRIKRGAKLDHYVHVGHNSQVGLDTIVTAGVVFCGKSSVGDRAWLGVGSILKEGVVVEDDTFVGFGSVVLKTVKAGTTVIGVPARPLDKK